MTDETQPLLAVIQTDYEIAEQANVLWGMAINGPHVAVLAAALSRLRTTPAAAKPHDADVVEHMVQRFLSWKLPDNFNPDAGISFKAEFNDSPAAMQALGLTEPMRHQPTGTNLLDYEQARAMVLHMLEGSTLTPSPPATERDRLVDELGFALAAQSALLRKSGHLDDDTNHAAYERVVAAFNKLTSTTDEGNG